MSVRRLLSFFLYALLVLAAASVRAQPDAAGADSVTAYATGDAWIDRQLADIDAYARRYPDSFVDELARNFGLRRGYVEAVLRAPGWRPGDLYFACAWAQATQGSCREWVRAFSAGRAEGWAAVLAQEGEPDNASFRAVRHAIVASFDRWDRPIELDARLKQQLGDPDQRLARMRAAAQEAASATPDTPR